MSWPWQRNPGRWSPAHRTPPARPAAGPLEMIDPASLEVVELDGEGRLHPPAPARRTSDLREIGYAPASRDPTGVAGLWEALNGA